MYGTYWAVLSIFWALRSYKPSESSVEGSFKGNDRAPLPKRGLGRYKVGLELLLG